MSNIFEIANRPELVRETYSINYYNGKIFKVVKFKSDKVPLGPGPAENHATYEEKLDQSVSRSRRMVLEYALCNQWDYFCTLTLDPQKHDRSDLREWHRQLMEWFRYLRKQGQNIQFLLVPERHADGAWHAHGLLKLDNVPLVSFADMLNQGDSIPLDLAVREYMNWPEYQKKFGFCSLGKILNETAVAFYVTKYITKDVSRMVTDVGVHSYWPSRGLNRAVKHGSVYGHSSYLDKFCTQKFEFVETGFTHLRDNCDWTFGLDYMDFEPLFPADEEPAAEEIEVDNYIEFTQLCMELYS